MNKRSIPQANRESLKRLAKRDLERGLRIKFADCPERAAQFSFAQGPLYFDFSKTHISDELLDQYSDIATQIDFEGQRGAMFCGAPINNTENRAALHTLLRSPDNAGANLQDDHLRQQAESAAESLRGSIDYLRKRLAKRSKPIKDILHVGIGGSSLGTQLIFQALKRNDEAVNIHFVANIDGHQLAEVLAKCNAECTLLIGISKTFTTAETLQNIRSIGNWFGQHGQQDYLSQMLAVTAEPENAQRFGVAEENIVIFPKWVGGRYSLWSSVSLSAILLLEFDTFRELLRGAADMDAHFLTTPTRENLSFIAAALDHYYVNYLGAASRAIFAYDHRLRSLVDYLQQLETESNGKDRQRDGQPTDQLTSPVVWGGVGTNVQHSVFQMLHQGTQLIPAEFIAVINANHHHDHHHKELLANFLAQPAALLAGQSIEKVRQLQGKQSTDEHGLQAKVFSGNRPSTSILMHQLNAYTLGALLSFYEHRTFCFGALCNINSFDQMGVELGKRLAKSIGPLVYQQPVGANDLDESTNNLLEQIFQHRIKP